jgi:geranylgeranyl pyrophosphate synthase
MNDLISLEKPKLAACKERVDAAIANRFDGNPRKLASFGLAPGDTEIALLLRDAMRTRGKRVRAYFLEQWYAARGGEDKQHCTDACIIIEALHAATLVIDDVQDRSNLRRGEPTFHTIHGEAVAISTGFQLLYGASEASRNLPNGERIQHHVVHFINELAIGQAKDVLWHRDARITISPDRFEQMCVEKTAKLFILAIRIAEEMAGHSIPNRALKAVRRRVSVVENYFPDTEKQAEAILEIIGVIYQLADDVANITIDIGKDFGEDIRERKITAPVIAAYAHGGTAVRSHLNALYRKRGVTNADVHKTISLLIACGAIERVEERIQTLLTLCCERLIASQLAQREKELLSTLSLLSAKR